MKFISQNLIKAVALIPGYTFAPTTQTWPAWQSNVAIYTKTVEGTQQLCGILSDYFAKYSEALCNFQANEIVVVQQNAANNLVFCGFVALAECNCAQASLDPARFTMTQTPLASATSLSITSTDSV
jgi:hypothetical protein